MPCLTERALWHLPPGTLVRFGVTTDQYGEEYKGVLWRWRDRDGFHVGWFSRVTGEYLHEH